jgi:hypothetical protein
MRYVVHVDASTLYSLQMCRGSVWSLPYLGLSKVPITGTIGSDDKMALNKAIFILDPHNTSISVSRILGLAYSLVLGVLSTCFYLRGGLFKPHFFFTQNLIVSSLIDGTACPDNSRGTGDLLPPPYLLPIVNLSFKLPSMGHAQKFSYTNSD